MYSRMEAELAVDVAEPMCRMYVVYVLQPQYDHDSNAQ